jgi:hypothetical protein
MSTGVAPTITLIENDDGWWTARDEARELTSQGKTRADALDNLDEAIALDDGDIGRDPSDEDLREIGINPEENTTGSIRDADLFE